jgi:hypothetical protein
VYRPYIVGIVHKIHISGNFFEMVCDIFWDARFDTRVLVVGCQSMVDRGIHIFSPEFVWCQWFWREVLPVCWRDVYPHAQNRK